MEGDEEVSCGRSEAVGATVRGGENRGWAWVMRTPGRGRIGNWEVPWSIF